MSEWRHVEQTVECPVETRWAEPCGCTTPTPDLSSPCAVEGCRMLNGYGHILAFTPDEFVPTRCTCGHPIEPGEGMSDG